MSDSLQHELFAREIAASVLAKSGRRIPVELLPEVTELLTDAAHDGVEFGESFASAIETGHPPGISVYMGGYLAAITDIDKGQAQRGEPA